MAREQVSFLLRKAILDAMLCNTAKLYHSALPSLPEIPHEGFSFSTTSKIPGIFLYSILTLTILFPSLQFSHSPMHGTICE